MHRSIAPLFAVLLVVAAAPSPLLAAAPSQDSLEPLAFMSGCWRTDTGADFMEEIYTEAAPNLVLGLNRTVRDGRVVAFEFTRIELREDGVYMVPYPNGRPSSDAFRLTSTSGAEAVFEAPEHDFPRRIVYRREQADGLQARIDDGTDDGQSMEWRMHRAACPGER